MKKPCAVMLISESRDYNQFLLFIKDANDCVEQLKDQYHDIDYLCEFFVETNDEKMNKKIESKLRKFLI